VLAKVDLRVNMVERYFRRVDKSVTGQERDVPIEMGAHFGYRLVNDRPEHSFLEPKALVKPSFKFQASALTSR